MGQPEEDEDALSTNYEPPTFKLYKRRWFILFVLSLLQCSNAMIWISYASIADLSATFYHTSVDVVNYLAMVYMVASVVFGMVSAFILDHLGLRAGIIAGAWLNFVGAAIKLLSAYPGVIPPDTLIVVTFIGQSIAAIAQPYNMFATTKLAALWFPEEHRALANTIASMANPLGILVGSLLSPGIVRPTENDAVLAREFQTLLAVNCGPAGLAAVLALVVVTSSKPRTPPSASAGEESMSFVAGLKQIVRIKDYWMVVACCGAGIALYTAITTLLQQMLCPYGYSDTFAGICSAVNIGAGLAGAGITGALADKTKKFEEICKIFFTCAIICIAAFTIVIRYSHQEALVAVTVGAFGFFGFGLYPLCLELGVEVTYPVAEATSSALIIISGQIQSIIYLLVMQSTAVNIPNATCSGNVAAQDFIYSNVFFISMAFLAAAAFIIFFKASYKRMRAEQEAAAERILDFNSSDNPATNSGTN
ncbi:solute carrier family 49 member A3-like [Watersipora subatra]|uniref:solute carrier family 49 member A3-like n=1 Tax=Watersipora subatra TaxID=2589382 RepID=UPI00355C8A89